MADILQFKKPKPKVLGLCQHGHHKWKVDKNTRFDTQKGSLVTKYVCIRCGKFKTKAT